MADNRSYAELVQERDSITYLDVCAYAGEAGVDLQYLGNLRKYWMQSEDMWFKCEQCGSLLTTKIGLFSFTWQRWVPDDKYSQCKCFSLAQKARIDNIWLIGEYSDDAR